MFRDTRHAADRVLSRQTWVDLLPQAPDPAAVLVSQRACIARLQGKTFFCAVARAKVPAARCLQLQFSPTCFGCSAASHLCHACRVRPLAFPELELCQTCLLRALAWEIERGVVSVERNDCASCQRVNRIILVGDCRELQGKGTADCRGCGQASRWCERCRRLPVCYPEDGWCRSCAVEHYGGDEGKALLDRVRTKPQRQAILAQAPWVPVPPPPPAEPPRLKPTPLEVSADTPMTTLAFRVGRSLVEAYQAGTPVSVRAQSIHERFRITLRQAWAVKRLLVEWRVVRDGRGRGPILVPTVEQFDALASGMVAAVPAEVASPRSAPSGAGVRQLEQALVRLSGRGQYSRRTLARQLTQLASAMTASDLPLLADLLLQAALRLTPKGTKPR